MSSRAWNLMNICPPVTQPDPTWLPGNTFVLDGMLHTTFAAGTLWLVDGIHFLFNKFNRLSVVEELLG